jgi:hypothetical protein
MLAAAVRVSRMLDGRRRSVGEAIRPPAPPLPIGPILVEVTGTTSIATRRWRYNFTEVWVDASDAAVTRPNGITGTFLNTLEFRNSSTVIRPGVLVANLIGTYDVQPLSGTTLIWPFRRSDGSLLWLANVTNAIDGACP